ncbi:hypothetical protein G7Z17_g1100 [Cylindrodendrum hubeiense]|uniref:Uncharacterized protein n=1 Tax=Cylindrodendrum hubeiense TaxID=595255 RepID=A0A9P5HQT3_9HYPO|nr:hypothetical protein G7Z17_g1100 [Cylindrodendrum hubeiense]
MEGTPDLWAQAFRALPPEAQSGFSNLASSQGPLLSRMETVNQLIQLTQKRGQECQAKFGSFRFGRHRVELGECIGNIINWLDKFKEVGDTVVQFDPVHAALPWAAFRFILQSAVIQRQEMETILEVLETISRLVHHGRVLEFVYTSATTCPQNEPLAQQSLNMLREKLVKLYGIIFKTLDHCYSKLNKRTIRRVATAIFKFKETEDLLHELETQESKGAPEMIHNALRGLQNRLEDEGSALDAPKCQRLLKVLIASYTSTTIIIDALDECEKDTRSVLMESLDILMRGNKLKVFISSRPDGDIRRYFRSRPLIEIKGTDNEDDISDFVQDKLSKDSRWNALSSSLQQEIMSRLHQGSQGMFQWAALQIQQLLRLALWNKTTIMDRLDNLPLDLTAAYNEIWSEVELFSIYERQLAERMLQWVLCAFKPLTTKQLANAISIDPFTDAADSASTSLELEEEEINDLCRNLLALDKGLGVWNFCHLSAREYFEEHHRNATQSHQFIGMACLKFFIAEPYLHWGRREFTRSFSFYKYVIIEGLNHVAKSDEAGCEGNDRLKDLLKRFFRSMNHGSKEYYSWVNATKQHSALNLTRGSEMSSPMLAICKFGIYYALADWWEDATVHLNTCSPYGDSLLSMAIFSGREPLWRFLISKKVDLEQGRRLPLGTAIEQDRWDLFNAMVDAGADVNAYCLFYRLSVLMLAVSKVRESPERYVRVLLERGANVELKTRSRRTAFEYAAKFSTEKVVRMLLEAGAELKNPTDILLEAADRGNLDLALACIQKGADINHDAYGVSTPLMLAATKGHTNVARCLLTAGAFINIAVKSAPGTALAAASIHPESGIFQLLLDGGADVNLTSSGSYGTMSALTWTIHLDTPVAFELLLDAGANVSLVLNHPHEPTALCTAILRHKLYCIASLLKAGADINQGNRRVTPLCIAVSDRETGLTELLLAMGADPSLLLPEGFGSALATAAFCGNLAQCRLLLRCGVDVNTPLGAFFPNVLVAAMAGRRALCRPSGVLAWPQLGREHLKVIRMFFNEGVEIPMPRYISLDTPSPDMCIPLLGVFRMEATRAFHCGEQYCQFAALSPSWLGIMWILGTSAEPQLPLRMLLQQCGFPRSLPSSVTIVTKFRSILQPKALIYSIIKIHGESSRAVCVWLTTYGTQRPMNLPPQQQPEIPPSPEEVEKPKDEGIGPSKKPPESVFSKYRLPSILRRLL